MKLLFHGIGVYEQGKPFGPACWPHHDLLVLKAGQILFESPKGRVNLEAGDAIWIPPRLHFHGWTESDTVMWVTHFENKKLRAADYTTDFAAGLGLFRGGVRSELAKALMDRLHDIYQGDSRWPVLADAYLRALLAEIRRNRQWHAESDEQWLHALEQWSRRLLHTGIGVREMAREAQLSESHFRKIFRQRGKVSAGHFLHRLRLNEAKTLLQKSSMSLKAIGAEVGYSDTVAFHRAFTSHFGITPGRYRRSIGVAI